MMRLFFALLPPYGLHATLAPIMGGVAGARWQRADQLHLTLRFVGDASSKQAEGLSDRLSALHPHLPPIALEGVGRFDGAGGRANALWLRASPKAPLEALHIKLDRLCQMEGFPPERRAFLPHLTVARLPRSAAPVEPWLAQHAGLSLAPLPFRSLALIESVMTDEGSHYETVAEARIAISGQ